MAHDSTKYEPGKPPLNHHPTITPVVAALIVALAFIFAGTLLGLAVTDKLDNHSTPMLTTVLGFVGVLITQFVNGRKTTQVEQKISNGYLDEKIRRNVQEVMNARDPQIVADMHQALDEREGRK